MEAILFQQFPYAADGRETLFQPIGVVDGAVLAEGRRTAEALNGRWGLLDKLKEVGANNGEGLRPLPELLCIKATGCLLYTSDAADE